MDGYSNIGMDLGLTNQSKAITKEVLTSGWDRVT